MAAIEAASCDCGVDETEKSRFPSKQLLRSACTPASTAAGEGITTPFAVIAICGTFVATRPPPGDRGGAAPVRPGHYLEIGERTALIVGAICTPLASRAWMSIGCSRTLTRCSLSS